MTIKALSKDQYDERIGLLKSILSRMDKMSNIYDELTDIHNEYIDGYNGKPFKDVPFNVQEYRSYALRKIMREVPMNNEELKVIASIKADYI